METHKNNTQLRNHAVSKCLTYHMPMKKILLHKEVRNDTSFLLDVHNRSFLINMAYQDVTLRKRKNTWIWCTVLILNINVFCIKKNLMPYRQLLGNCKLKRYCFIKNTNSLLFRSDLTKQKYIFFTIIWQLLICKDLILWIKIHLIHSKSFTFLKEQLKF